jgi:hypothetical protein
VEQNESFNHNNEPARKTKKHVGKKTRRKKIKEKKKHRIKTILQIAAGCSLGSGRSLLVLQKVADHSLCHGSKQILECGQNYISSNKCHHHQTILSTLAEYPRTIVTLDHHIVGSLIWKMSCLYR